MSELRVSTTACWLGCSYQEPPQEALLPPFTKHMSHNRQKYKAEIDRRNIHRAGCYPCLLRDLPRCTTKRSTCGVQDSHSVSSDGD